jgi:hypothetical protein
MSEVDRLSNSGLYPALPVADKSSRKDGSAGKPPGDGKSADKRPPAAPAAENRDPPRPPKSLIDDYA